MLETLLKKAAHRCKMKGIVFKRGSQSMDLVCTARQASFTEKLRLA